MFKKIFFLGIFLTGFFYLMGSAPAFSGVLQDGEKTYIVDRHGERWDVTQAMSIGFEPGRFRHGIGRNAFTPLDDSSLSEDTSSARLNQRVIVPAVTVSPSCGSSTSAIDLFSSFVSPVV